MGNQFSSPLFGLVLMGGKSVRMGHDKALLRYHSQEQWQYCFQILAQKCDRVFFSCQKQPSFIKGNCILDKPNASFGPISGIISALEKYPFASWLVLAIDMPWVKEGLLSTLVEFRDRKQYATVFVNEKLACEPLCAIYEPGILPILSRQKAKGPRFILENLVPVQRIFLAEFQWLRSINTPKERQHFLLKTGVAT